MANNSGNTSGTAFTGYSGGHDLVPGLGNVAPATFGTAGVGMVGTSTLGANLPHVDPNNFQGTVHWGPQQTVTGAQVNQVLPGGIAGFGTGPK